jgi:hypothetical protein
MAKYATRRSYKKRASKKRHTIRKLKRTMRRKMQRGGVGPEEAMMIKLMLELAPQVIPIILSLIKLGNVELLMSIITLLSGKTVSIPAGGFGGGSGSNKQQRQRGGGRVKESVLNNLNGLAITFRSNQDVVNCINIIKARIPQQSEPAAPAALDSSAELASSLQTELTTDTNITASDTVDLNQDTALTDALETQQGALNASVDSPLPEDVKKAAKDSIINKMIEFFNNRIKNKITAKLDGMISNLRGKVGEDVIDCIRTLKTAIVEDIVTQIKSNVSQISSRILSGIGGVAGGVFQFLVWSAVQMALGNYGAILTEGGTQFGKVVTNVVGATREKASQGAEAARDKFSQGAAVLGEKGRDALNNVAEAKGRIFENISTRFSNIGNPLRSETKTQYQPEADNTQSQPQPSQPSSFLSRGKSLLSIGNQ